MSKQLYRAMVLGCVLIWLLIGMSVSGLLAGLDAGLRPEPNELLVTAFLGITGVLSATALLRYPASVPQNASSKPEQPEAPSDSSLAPSGTTPVSR